MDLTTLYAILYVIALVLALLEAFRAPLHITISIQLGWLALAVWITVPLIRLLAT